MRFKGNNVSVSLFGQSHAPAVGMVMEGLPAGVRLDLAALQAFLDRRAPGQGAYASARREADRPRFLSGLVDNTTCGAPLCAVIENLDAHSADYEKLRDIPRPSHADYPARVKYGASWDGRGGGAFSGRMTAPLCVAGSVALQILAQKGVSVGAHIAAIGSACDKAFDPLAVCEADFARARQNALPALNAEAAQKMMDEIQAAREAQDSLGGIVECAAIGLPVGLGGPLFEGLESQIAQALFAIPAVKGVEFGSGFAAAGMRGSQHNDPYALREGRVVTLSNHAGGLVGGMTTGMPLIVRAAFKPTPSIGQKQRSVDLAHMEETELVIGGRHDPCVVPRAVPVVEAAVSLVLLDEMLSKEQA